MAVGVLMQFPGGTNEQYDRVLTRWDLHGRTPEHALWHIAGEADDGLRIVDLWDSPEAFEAFADSKIRPICEAEGLGRPDVSMWEIHNALRRIPVGRA
jgi:hypothetical protein